MKYRTLNLPQKPGALACRVVSANRCSGQTVEPKRPDKPARLPRNWKNSCIVWRWLHCVCNDRVPPVLLLHRFINQFRDVAGFQCVDRQLLYAIGQHG